MIVDILTEVETVARAKKVNLESDIVEQSLAVVDSYPPDSMSSLAKDVLNKKPSEIDYQNGTIVKFGKELNIDTPVNKLVYGTVKLLEKKYK